MGNPKTTFSDPPLPKGVEGVRSVMAEHSPIDLPHPLGILSFEGRVSRSRSSLDERQTSVTRGVRSSGPSDRPFLRGRLVLSPFDDRTGLELGKEG
jgi:hypothetical protein